MADNLLPSPAELRQLLRYEPETGKLFWLRDGSEAFNSKDGQGYLRGTVLGKRIRAHRIAWVIQVGAWPTHHIDHINGDRSDNRIENLRDVPRLVNQKNMRRMRSNTSGVVGVSATKNGTWEAYIDHAGKRIRLGKHATLQEAAAIRCEAEKKYGFHENHGR